MWNEQQTCDSSLQWNLQAVEFQTHRNPTLLNVGFWNMAKGLTIFDDLFPHVTGGLRGRVVNVTSLEVVNI